jgi:hypothetical protein
MAAPDFDALARAFVVAAGRVAAGPDPIAKVCAKLASDLAAAWPTGPEHLPEWYAGYEAAMIDAARVEAERTSEADDLYVCPWSADERHRHTIGGKTYEHAHEGGHEAHSAVSHDLSDAGYRADLWCSACGRGPARHLGVACPGGFWHEDEDAARQTRYALGGEPASMGGDA